MKYLGTFLINNNFNDAISLIDKMMNVEIEEPSQSEYIKNNLKEIQVLIFMGLGNYELYNIYLDLRYYIQYGKINWGTRLINHRFDNFISQSAPLMSVHCDIGSLYALPVSCLYKISQNL